MSSSSQQRQQELGAIIEVLEYYEVSAWIPEPHPEAGETMRLDVPNSYIAEQILEALDQREPIKNRGLGRYRRLDSDVEAVRFSGSTTHAGALRRWIETGEYQDSAIHTQDIGIHSIETRDGFRRMAMGDYLVREADGTFTLHPGEAFESRYTLR